MCLDFGWRPFASSRTNDALRQAYVTEREARYRADFAYFAGTGKTTYDGREVQALALPRPVLEKFFAKNAERIFKVADN